MKSLTNIIIIAILVMALTGCSAFTPKPTETPIPTATNLPTSTSTPVPTITPTPTEKPTEIPTKTPIPPTETSISPVLKMPIGKPMSNWEGIPILPNALAGDGDSEGYYFTVEAKPDEVQKFYEKAMANLGWNLFASGNSPTNSIILMFMKDNDLVTISIIPQDDGLMYVLLI